MLVYCKKNCIPFYNDNYYNIHADFHTIFEYRDFISIIDKNITNSTNRFRFRLNQSLQYVEGYIGETENYFYDYFIDVLEERKEKLQKISNVTEL